jgi:hypothetical protein
MIIPVDYSQVNLKWAGNGLPLGAQTTFGIANDDDLPPSDIATKALAAWDDCGVMDNLSVQVSVTSCLVKNGPNEIGPAAEVAATVAGTSGSEPLPPNVSVLVAKNTPAGGRMGKGRLFLPGLPEGSTPGGGVLAPTPLAEIQGKMNALLTNLRDSNIPMVLLHSKVGVFEIPLVITSLTVQSRMATQRRRLR